MNASLSKLRSYAIMTQFDVLGENLPNQDQDGHAVFTLLYYPSSHSLFIITIESPIDMIIEHTKPA